MNSNTWSIACSLIYLTFNTNRTTCGVCLTGLNGFALMQHSKENANKPDFLKVWNDSSTIKDGWPKDMKKGNLYNSYISSHGVLWEMFGYQ